MRSWLIEILQSSDRLDNIRSVPHLFFEVDSDEWELREGDSARSEKLALAKFRKQGFQGCRVRYGVEKGYPGLILELHRPPHWVWVEWNDVFGVSEQERVDQLQPLYEQVLQNGAEAMYNIELQHRQAVMNKVLEKSPPDIHELEPEFDSRRFDTFWMAVTLAEVLTIEEFCKISSAVLDLDLLYVKSGTPDLLLWDQEHGTWFFSEVKAPGDQLRESQQQWIRSNWDLICSHFILVSLNVCA